MKLAATKGEYPRPPSDFVADTDATTMWEQYERYEQGRDRLLPMAYSCLTRLEHRARSHPGKGDARMKAASMYGVDYEVLHNLGRLATTLGDEVEVRKLGPQSELRTPTAQEVSWIEAALRLLIRRGAVRRRSAERLASTDDGRPSRACLNGAVAYGGDCPGLSLLAGFPVPHSQLVDVGVGAL